MACSSPAVLLLLAVLAGVAAAGDIIHQDDEAPKIPGCNNDFVLVRLSDPLFLVQLLWINFLKT
jgi:signal peptide peptidase-like protein 2B